MKLSIAFFFWYIAIFAIFYLLVINIQSALSYYWKAPHILNSISLFVLVVFCVPITFLLAKKMEKE